MPCVADVFVADVSDLRALDASRVLATEGGVLVGADAVAGGLADRLGSLEGLIAELNTSPGGSGRKPPSGSGSPAPATAQKGTPTVIRPAADAAPEPTAADVPPDPNAPPAQDGGGAPAFAVGARVVSLLDRGDIATGTHGAVEEARSGEPPYYAVLFDGQAEASKWWGEDELEAEQMDATAAALLKATGAKSVKEALALAAGHGRAGAKALAETKAAADADGS